MTTPAPTASGWDRALPYVPRTLVEAVRRRGRGDDGWVEALDGTLVVADISGFTPLSERLARLGGEGAERLTVVINGYFERLLDIAAGLGGDNLKFGGDALLLAFQGDRHADRAVAAAMHMQASTRRFPAVRIGATHQRLAMSIGVHTASFWFAAAGVEGRMQHLLFGGEAARLAATEGRAQRGEVVVTPRTRQALTDAAVDDMGDRLVVRRASAVRHTPAPTPRLVAAELPALLPYLPPPVARALQSSEDEHIHVGDHRRVAVLFLGLRGLNELADRDGPQVAFAEVRTYLRTVLVLLDRHHGYLAGNDIDPGGTKLICLFGAPVAAEDDAASALRFTVDLLDAWDARDSALTHQIGVNVGSVFAGDAGSSHRRDYTIIGDHVNLAARLMGAAEPGSAMVASWVEAGQGGHVLTHIDPITVKGKVDPVPVGVLRPGATWQDVPALATATPVFGRDGELAQLSDLLDRCAGGAGGAVHVVGDAGVGKSLLVETALRERQDWNVHEGRCHAYTTAQPFSCWVPVLRGLLAVEDVHDPRRRLAEARQALARLVPDRVDEVGLLAGPLGLDHEGTRWDSLDGEARRALMFSLVTDVVTASGGALALVIEDAQWADTSSVALIDHLARSLDDAPVVLIVTSRPTEHEVLGDHPAQIQLGPLPRPAVAALLQHLVGLRGDTLVDTVWDKTAGNPMFTTELARLLATRVSGDGGTVDTDDLPDRVQGLLMSRIDLLDTRVRHVLVCAAVLGSEFDPVILDELAEVAAGPMLEALRRARLVRPTAAGRYVFAQNLLQDVAYNSLLFSRRRELHRRAAAVIERRFADDLEPHLVDLARHHRHGGDPRRTIRYAVAAGDRAQRLHANAEALTSYRHALAAVDSLQERRRGGLRSLVRERIADSLELLGNHHEAAALYDTALRGWRASSAIPADLADLAAGLDAAERAPDLCRKAAWSHARTESQFERAFRWLDAAERAMPTSGHAALRGSIAIARATLLFRTGRYEDSIAQGRQGLRLSRRAGPSQLAQAHEALARPHLELGQLEVALHHRRAALRLHEQLEDTAGLMVAHNNIGSAEQLLGNLDVALEHYRQSRRAASRLRRAPSVAIVENNIGEVLLLQDRPDDAIPHLQACIDAFGGTGAVAGLALVNLAGARRRLDQLGEAREALQTGITLLVDVGASGLVAEALVARAQLSEAEGRTAQALEQAEQACAEAERLGMALVAARAHLVLGQLLAASGAADDARDHLVASRDGASRAGAEALRAQAQQALEGVMPAGAPSCASRRRAAGR